MYKTALTNQKLRTQYNVCGAVTDHPNTHYTQSRWKPAYDQDEMVVRVDEMAMTITVWRLH